MKRAILVAAFLSLALTACGDEPRRTVNVVDEPDQQEYNVDECPRSDGQPCA